MTQCDPGNHTWKFIRTYKGTETYDLRSITRTDNDGKETTFYDGTLPAELEQPDGWDVLNVKLWDHQSSDEYDEVLDEWLECKYCDTKIVGDRIGEII